ncbi:hypothetical protein LXA43DRAFT_1155718 [Ganoderma leucocontextum]|nr:hypothetical protein LXA43DRAFT_1155718 [Ganoderma leucocontextum]
MGQFWHLINVDRREKDLTDSGKLGEFFFSDLGYLYKALHVPCLPKEVDEWLSRGTLVLQPKPIGALSTEVLDLIFEAILDDTERDPTKNFLTCIFLAITCKRLLSIGKRHILRALTSRYARAADCRILCLGEYADKEDQAPPGMLTDAEIKELETTMMPYECGEPDDEDIAARCLYVFALELYEPCRDALADQHTPIRALMDWIGRIRRKLRGSKDNLDRNQALSRDLDMIAALACVGYRPEPEYPDGPNVLCNLSKGECVREDALVKLESEWCSVTLAHAVLSRICYSPDPSLAMGCSEEYEDRIAKGPWAGDRFRITSAADMPQLKGGKEWKDVTKEVNRLLCHLWGNEMCDEEA